MISSLLVLPSYHGAEGKNDNYITISEKIWAASPAGNSIEHPFQLDLIFIRPAGGGEA